MIMIFTQSYPAIAGKWEEVYLRGKCVDEKVKNIEKTAPGPCAPGCSCTQ